MRVAQVYAVAASCLLALGGCESNAFLRKQAMDAVRAHEFAQAELRLHRAIERDPTDWRAHHLMGTVLLRSGRPLEAQHALEQALAQRAIEPEATAIRDELAEAVFRQGDHHGLARMLREATAARGTSYDFRRQGRYLGRIGDVDNAVVAFRKAARFAPGDPRPYQELADVYEATGNSQGAIDALRRGLGVEPDSRQIAGRLRAYGVVPGPTASLPPFSDVNP